MHVAWNTRFPGSVSENIETSPYANLRPHLINLPSAIRSDGPGFLKKFAFRFVVTASLTIPILAKTQTNTTISAKAIIVGPLIVPPGLKDETSNGSRALTFAFDISSKTRPVSATDGISSSISFITSAMLTRDILGVFLFTSL